MSLFGGDRSVFDTMRQFFIEDDWRFDQIESEPMLKMGFTGKNGSWRCIAQAREDQKQVVFYSRLEVRVPEAKRAAMAEFLTRANFGLFIGNFEMDFDDGEIRYKTSVDIKDNEDKLTSGIVKRLVYMNVFMTDRYFPGIMSVIYAGTKPKDAVDACEA